MSVLQFFLIILLKLEKQSFHRNGKEFSCCICCSNLKWTTARPKYVSIWMLFQIQKCQFQSHFHKFWISIQRLDLIYKIQNHTALCLKIHEDFRRKRWREISSNICVLYLPRTMLVIDFLYVCRDQLHHKFIRLSDYPISHCFLLYIFLW